MAKRTLSRKELEELKKRQDQEATAEVFQQFVEEFQEDAGKVGKVWVKAGTYDAGARKEDTKDKGKLYKPTSKLADLMPLAGKAKVKTETREPPSLREARTSSVAASSAKLRGPGEKRKSQLEIFKEELRAIQEEREERHRIKSGMKASRFEPAPAASTKSQSSLSLAVEETKGSFDMGDPNTTNIYLGNINPKMTEQQLMDAFGKYGPLASVKVMWPRTEEEKARNRNCGFVAFMCRKDAERAMKRLNGKDVMGFEMKLGWGKALPIPARPIFVPQVLLETTLPPPPTGLPFNAIASQEDLEKMPPHGTPYPRQGEALRNFNKVHAPRRTAAGPVVETLPGPPLLLSLIARFFYATGFWSVLSTGLRFFS